ncbi:polysaccharide biosynthesis/export family protein [Methylobacterium brachythecii]|uniref:Exopolysaccharide production protein ExoF n=1 Tax=Methylobacterium brachythecii TaxID=1176177 RepID=A0A7W6AH12_9HYPH|nr:polysaccharide biosynthesis/export family protein [Methylobacterium brachythecii]MBB3903177.1 polysaccharide export outer membrane protein [Methylobacterium brachythecii]GLS44757.1 exopolysaccharide production protein ExoF [Methylobacterium brachythecii]
MTDLMDRSGLKRRACHLGALLVMVGLVDPAVAQDANYRLAPGDRVAVSVYGQADLSGEFGVGGGGSLFLPLIGEVSVSAMTLPEAQKQISERLGDGFLQRPVVSLRITEMRPIYMLGDVRLPGSYPFRYGSSVLSGIALAGGFGVPEQAQINLRTEFLAADERVRVLEANRRLYLIRRARLEAQRQNRNSFEAPFDPPDEGSVGHILAEERDILTAQQGALSQAVLSLQAQKPRLEAEIAGVRAQRASEETQLQLIQSHIEDYQKLMASGLARRYQGIEFQREEARNRGAIARMNSDLARLDLALGDLVLRLQETKDAYYRKVMSELQDVTTRLVETETQLPIVREIREAKLQSGGTLAAFSGAPLKRKVFVTRVQDKAPATFEATESTLLAPGDIVDIRREPASPALQSNAASFGDRATQRVSENRP